jgi:hypothetical protein
MRESGYYAIITLEGAQLHALRKAHGIFESRRGSDPAFEMGFASPTLGRMRVYAPCPALERFQGADALVVTHEEPKPESPAEALEGAGLKITSAGIAWDGKLTRDGVRLRTLPIALRTIEAAFNQE